MRTTQQMRDLYEPHCNTAGRHNVSLLPVWHRVDGIMKAFGYRPRHGVTYAFNCRPITGGTNWSLHAYAPGEEWETWTGVLIHEALATDFNSDTNPYGHTLVTDMPRAMVDAICAIVTIDGLPVIRWGGYYEKNKDAMHFEIIASPSEIARGLAGQSPQQEPWDMLSPTGQARFEKLFHDDDRWTRLNALLDKADELGTITDQWEDHREKSEAPAAGGSGLSNDELAAALRAAADKLSP